MNKDLLKKLHLLTLKNVCVKDIVVDETIIDNNPVPVVVHSISETSANEIPIDVSSVDTTTIEIKKKRRTSGRYKDDRVLKNALKSKL